jgi:hypothetical protein
LTVAEPRVEGEGPPSRWRYLVALPLAIVGYFSGGMLGVAVAKMVGGFNGCVPVEGFPACNFEPYLRGGTLVGVLLLPGFLIWRLWQSGAAYRHSQRG